jgi:thymidylate synthase (FAD)
MNSARIFSVPTNLAGEDMTLTDQVVYCARISNPESQAKGLNGERLINYLIEHKHWSPFEMVTIVMDITTTRDIARQLLRHRSFSFQEFSQRYATQYAPMHYREARMQGKNNRQSSLPTEDQMTEKGWYSIQKAVENITQTYYDEALNMGIAKEVARAILPEGMTESRLFVSGSLRSWIHYIEVRTDPSTQKEHRDLATRCAEAIDPFFPYISRFIQM